MKRPNLLTFSFHQSSRELGKMWTVERAVGFGDPRYHVRCYDRLVLISDLSFDSEIAARAEFERKVEEHYQPALAVRR